jgi:hypothetical protein
MLAKCHFICHDLPKNFKQKRFSIKMELIMKSTSLPYRHASDPFSPFNNSLFTRADKKIFHWNSRAFNPCPIMQKLWSFVTFPNSSWIWKFREKPCGNEQRNKIALKLVLFMYCLLFILDIQIKEPFQYKNILSMTFNWWVL